jgi:hypothetical protein
VRKDAWGSGDTAPPFLFSAFNGGEWSVSRSGRFIPRETDPGIHWIEGWVGPRACKDGVEKGKSFPLLGFKPRLSSP